MTSPARPRGDLATAAVVLLVPTFLLRASITGGVLYERDVHLLWHAQVEGFVRAAAAGALPAWDAWIGFGQPLLANPNTQVYYPPTWLNLVMPPWAYYTLYAWAHLAWAGLGMVRLCRAAGVSRPGARVAAATWMASGPLVSLVSMWNHFAGAAWMPWVVTAALRFSREPSSRSASLLGLALAAQFLAGSPDLSAYTGLVVAAMAGAAILRRRHAPRTAGRVAALAALSLAITVGLAAAQWLPTLEVVRASARWGLPDDTRAYWSVHPIAALELLWPALWRTLPLSAAGREAFFETREAFLASIYLGLPALGLVLPALRRGTAPVRAFALLLGFAVVASLGRHTPAYEWLVAAAPVLRLSRFPVKVLPLAAMAWAGLCGAGWDAWRDERISARATWVRIAAVMIMAAAAGIALVALLPRLAPAFFEVSPSRGFPGYLVAGGIAVLVSVAALARAERPRLARTAATAVALLAVADLLAFHRNTNPAAPPALYRHRPPVAQAIPPGARVFTFAPEDGAAARRGEPAGLERMPAGWSPPEALALAQQLSLESLTAARWAIRGSFGIDYMSLQPRPVTELSALLALSAGTPAYERLLRAGGVTHVVTRDARFTLPSARLAAEFEGLYRLPVRLLEVASPVPRVLVVGASRPAEDVLALADPAFDPRREVLLPAGAPPGAVAEPPGFAARVEALEERADRLRARVRLSHPGHLVVLDAWDPGWRAEIDGAPAPVVRANHGFRAVEIPAGRHEVEMSYRPPSVRAGIAVSLATLAALGVAAAMGARRP